MYGAGFNPKAMAEFFQKLEQQGGGGGPQFLSDHPNPGNRVASVDKEIQNWPPKNYLGTSQAFVSAKQQANGIKTYTAQQISDGAKQGVWAQQNAQSGATPPHLPSASTNNNGGAVGAQSANITNVSYKQVKPSGNFTQLQHNAFNISYPSNWQTAGDQNSTLLPSPRKLGLHREQLPTALLSVGPRTRTPLHLIRPCKT